MTTSLRTALALAAGAFLLPHRVAAQAAPPRVVDPAVVARMTRTTFASRFDPSLIQPLKDRS
jgi:hypothetical protein